MTMQREIEIVITVSIGYDVDPQVAGESLFQTASEYADESLIGSVDDWKVRL